MKVHELISILEDCDPDAEVILAQQPNYPMEHALVGVAVREEYLDLEDEDDEDGEDGEEGPYSQELGQGARRNDVLLLDGQHLRYGDRDAWNNARTE